MVKIDKFLGYHNEFLLLENGWFFLRHECCGIIIQGFSVNQEKLYKDVTAYFKLH
jgi:hypothetical protein